jgi:hypothetical protein
VKWKKIKTDRFVDLVFFRIVCQIRKVAVLGDERRIHMVSGRIEESNNVKLRVTNAKRENRPKEI